MKKRLNVLLLTLILAFTFATPSLASEVNKKDGVVPLGELNYQTFVNSRWDYETTYLYVSAYGTPEIKKEVGYVSINYQVEWDEVWLVDQFGNKVSLESMSNPRFVPSSAARTYSLKAYETISGEQFNPTSSSITLFGFATWAPPLGVTQTGSFNVALYPHY